jgi:DNA helicase HerA-like ATPase
MKKFCFIIDEAHKIFSAKHDRDLEFSDISTLVRRICEFDVSLFVADQLPSELSRSIIGESTKT